MRITEIRECSIPISRYADALPSRGFTTSLVEIVTDVVCRGKPITGRGYASVGRYAQSGLLRDRFIPRLLQADPAELLLSDQADNFDPFNAWDVMMAGEKPGGHGERCVAVGALDMALWDIAAKIADEPLYAFLAKWVGRDMLLPDRVRVYAGGGYRYPHRDVEKLADEMRRIKDLGFTHAKMKIGSPDIAVDLKRIEAAAQALGNAAHLAVDAMNIYRDRTYRAAASALAPLGLWWFEDVSDPHDFETQSSVAALYPGPLGAGEALFSLGEARLLDAHGGLRRDRDVLLFDPVHCYGVPGYVRIVDALTARGWPRQSFWPHGGHLFSLHLVAALGLGGAEVTPFAFHPFSQLADGLPISAGYVDLPQEPGIGFELNAGIMRAFTTAFA